MQELHCSKMKMEYIFMTLFNNDIIASIDHQGSQSFLIKDRFALIHVFTMEI